MIRIEKTPLEGLYVLHTEAFRDDRGSFMRLFSVETLETVLGNRTLSHINLSTTHHKGTIRGMHYQLPPYAETKIVRCLKGSIFDVAVDVREGSKTFLQWFGMELTGENQKALLIPEGFAHGFQSLENSVELLYLHTASYQREAEKSLHFLDPAVSIAWPLKPQKISSKDQNVPFIDTNCKRVTV